MGRWHSSGTVEREEEKGKEMRVWVIVIDVMETIYVHTNIYVHLRSLVYRGQAVSGAQEQDLDS